MMHANSVACPYCDGENSDIHECFRGSSNSVELSCGCCSRKFGIQQNISVDYDTYEIEENSP